MLLVSNRRYNARSSYTARRPSLRPLPLPKNYQPAGRISNLRLHPIPGNRGFRGSCDHSTALLLPHNRQQLHLNQHAQVQKEVATMLWVNFQWCVWYCDDKWIPGHVCKHNFLAYMGVDPEDEEQPDLDSELPEDNVITADLSHVNAIDGRQRAKAINIMATIRDSSVSVLVDTGSSHDFLHPRVAEKLSLPLTMIKPFRVYVGNGASLICSHVSKQTVVDLQGHIFWIDLHILPFHGPDMILGMEWLESLGRVTHDYVARTMEVFKDDTLVVLRGLASLPRQISVPFYFPFSTSVTELSQFPFFLRARRKTSPTEERICDHSSSIRSRSVSESLIS